MDSIGLRVQELSATEQVLVLARLAEARSPSARFGPGAVDELFDAVGLPRPRKTVDTLSKLKRSGFMSKTDAQGSWRLTPVGRARSTELVTDMDLAALMAEMSDTGGPSLAATVHPLIPPTLAPPELLKPLRNFLAEHPFDRNVFGMTRFPDEQDQDEPDPVTPALEVARDACAAHGLEFHLASDRAIVDDLWGNVTAHMWASRYGIAFFEDRRGRGLNYNLTIEVGGMLLAGRRCALLKDRSSPPMPTDLVGRIYQSVDLDKPSQVADEIHQWIRDDLALGSCGSCPSASPEHR